MAEYDPKNRRGDVVRLCGMPPDDFLRGWTNWQHNLILYVSGRRPSLPELLVFEQLRYWWEVDYNRHRAERMNKLKGVPGRPLLDIPLKAFPTASHLHATFLGLLSRSAIFRTLASLEALGLFRTEAQGLGKPSIRWMNRKLIEDFHRDWTTGSARNLVVVDGELLQRVGLDSWESPISSAAPASDTISIGVPETDLPACRSGTPSVPIRDSPRADPVLLACRSGTVPLEIEEGKEEGKKEDSESRATPPVNLKDSPNEPSLTGGALGESRWVVEGVDFGPGSKGLHGNLIDSMNIEDFQAVVRILKLAQNNGYGVTLPKPEKKTSITIHRIAQILQEYRIRIWGDRFTPAFVSGFGYPDGKGDPRTWVEVEGDLAAAFAHDLVQKLGAGRNPGPFLEFLEHANPEGGVTSNFWVALTQIERQKPRPGPSAILRGKISEASMERLTRRWTSRDSGPRDPKTYWRRCLQVQEFLEEHRSGIKVHAALVGGYFRKHELDVAEVLYLYDRHRIDAGMEEPTAWPPEPGTPDWAAFLSWGRGLSLPESFDLSYASHLGEDEAADQKLRRDALACFDYWARDSEYRVEESVAEATAREASPQLRGVSSALVVRVVRILQARRACTREKQFLPIHLRALWEEVNRIPPGGVLPTEEVAWAVVGTEAMMTVKARWVECFPERLKIPEARFFDGLPDLES